MSITLDVLFLNRLRKFYIFNDDMLNSEIAYLLGFHIIIFSSQTKFILKYFWECSMTAASTCLMSKCQFNGK